MIEVHALHLFLTYSSHPTITYHHPEARELGHTHLDPTARDRALCEELHGVIAASLAPKVVRIGDTTRTFAPILHWFVVQTNGSEHEIEAVVGYEGLTRNDSVYLPLPDTHRRRVKLLHTRARTHAGLRPPSKGDVP